MDKTDKKGIRMGTMQSGPSVAADVKGAGVPSPLASWRSAQYDSSCESRIRWRKILCSQSKECPIGGTF